MVSGADHLPGPGALIHPKGRGRPPLCRGLLAGNGLTPRDTRLQHRFQGRHAIAFPGGFPVFAGGPDDPFIHESWHGRDTKLGFPGPGPPPDHAVPGQQRTAFARAVPVPGVLRPHPLKLPGSSRATGKLAGLGLPSGAWLKSPGAGNPQGDDPFSGLPQCWHLHKTESSQLFRHRTNSAHLFALKQEHLFPAPPGIIMPTAGQSEKYTS